MDLKKNKSGFTLIELLAVIVILAIIILIASSNIGGMMTTARKNALAVEGDTLVNTAKSAYQMEVLNGNIISTDTVCFSLDYLYKTGLFTKGSSDKYNGSVLITPDKSGAQYTYTAWISNGNYKIDNAPLGKITGNLATVNTAAASENCGAKAGSKLFNATVDASGNIKTTVKVQ